MDTVPWNLSPQDQRFAFPGLAPGQALGGNDTNNSGYLAALQQAYGGHNFAGFTNPVSRSPGMPALDAMQPPFPQHVPNEPLAGQGGAAWPMSTPMPQHGFPNEVPMDASPATDSVQTPVISVRAASPSSKENDSTAMMSILSHPDNAEPTYMTSMSPTFPDHFTRMGVQPSTSHPESSTAFAMMLASPAQEKALHTLPMNTSLSQPSLTNPNQFVPQDLRRRDSAQLRNFLKLDVNMGFVSDGKNESPTMLQPTVGWKKRRSVSDVGPRTPSMLGFAMDNQVISPMDDMTFLVPEPRAPPKEPQPQSQQQQQQQQPGIPMDPAAHFASLNLDVDGERQGSRSAPAQAQVPPVSTELMSNPTIPSPTSPVTLNPNLIQGIPMMPQPVQAFHHSVFAEDTNDGSAHTGPIRPKVSGRTSRSTSPYQTPNRSITPESELSYDDSELGDATRMVQWRFPSANMQSTDSLHPMDAYSRPSGGLPMQNARYPSNARGTRRHMRAAVSEDFQGRAREPVANWGHSVDLLREPFSPFSLLSPHSSAGSDQGSRAVSPDVALWAATQESQRLQMQSGRTSPAQSDAATQLSGSSTAASSPDAKAVQTAAQTRTPIVTTSAAQAASASRRKAEALFTCPFPDCDSTFTRQYNLRGHMRSHMDQRPFKCEWPGCGRSFARTHDCKRHHNLHLNIKPYSCESCGKTFARLDALNRHHKSEAGTCGGQSDGRDSSNTPG